MRLHEILKERGMSRLQLALKAEITPSDLYLALSGKKPLYPGWKRRIAECLEMDEAELFSDLKSENT